MKYPNPEKIMAIRIVFNTKIIQAIIEWKEKHYKNWKNQKSTIKVIGIIELYKKVCEIKKKLLPNMVFSNRWAYNQDLKTIIVDGYHLSIISALHELSHYLNGPSELKACRWSIQLFQTCFSKDFKKLKWKNHLLIKN